MPKLGGDGFTYKVSYNEQERRVTMYLFLFCRVAETALRMEDTQVVYKLDITRHEAKLERMLLCNKVENIERLSLGFSNRWNVCTARKTPVASKGATGVLNQDSLRDRSFGRLVI